MPSKKPEASRNSNHVAQPYPAVLGEQQRKDHHKKRLRRRNVQQALCMQHLLNCHDVDDADVVHDVINPGNAGDASNAGDAVNWQC